MRKLTLASVLVLSLSLGSLLLMAPVGALTPITVTTTDDLMANDGLCSLREAIIAANTDTASGSSPGECPAGSGPDTIEFGAALPQPAVFVLTQTGAGEDSALSGDLDLIGTLTINGAGSQNTVVDGNASDRVFEVRPGARVTMTGLTIRNGNPGADVGGGFKVLGALSLGSSDIQVNHRGGIRNEGGSVTLGNTQILTNTGGYGLDNYQGVLSYTGGEVRDNQGGGIRNSLGTATLTNVSIVGNTNGGGVHNAGFTLTKVTLDHSVVLSNTTTGSGGGILNEGVGATADIRDTRISGNTAAASGGGIFNNGTMTVQRSVVDNNQARSGAGVDHFGGTLNLTNDTLSSNIASDNGGGLYNRGSATLTYVTLSGNTASGIDTGGNIFNDEAQLSIRNSIVAYSDLDGNCFNSAGFLNSLGHNLDSANTCGFSAAGDLINSDPLLGPLQDNGGPTWTHALMAGSPAIDAGDNATCPATDQRGVPRPQGMVCDMGAYELIVGGEADLVIAKTSSPSPVDTGATLVYTLLITNAGPDTATAITVTDELPVEVTYSGTSGTGWSCVHDGGVVTCTRASLAVAAAPSIAITVTAPGSSGTLTNTAEVSSQLVDSKPANNSAKVVTQVKSLYHVYLPLVLR